MAKTTKDRIFHLIEGEGQALSHHDICDLMVDLPNRVTIYRAIDKLIEEGKVHKILDSNGVSKYAVCENCESHGHQHDHIHFSCMECGKVECVPDQVPKVKLPEGYSIKQKFYTITGICPECNN